MTTRPAPLADAAPDAASWSETMLTLAAAVAAMVSRARPAPGHRLTLSVGVDQDGVRVEVLDPDAAPGPAPAESTRAARRLATTYGWSAGHAGGNLVWAGVRPEHRPVGARP